MNHTEFDFLEDLTRPLYKFLVDNNIDLLSQELRMNHNIFIRIPSQYFLIPGEWRTPQPKKN